MYVADALVIESNPVEDKWKFCCVNGEIELQHFEASARYSLRQTVLF